MSDPYIPPRPGTAPLGSPLGTVPGTEHNRTTINQGGPQHPVAIPGRSGFGTGMLVAAVFVVVAIMAYAIFGNSDRSVPAPVTAPAATIDNSSPATTAPDAVTPAPDPAPLDATPDAPAVPEPAVPEPAVPDPAVPAPANP